MLDLRLFRDRRFSVASAGIALTFFTMFGMFFVLTQYLQLVLGYSPLRAGLMFLPVSLTMMLVAPQAPKLVARYGVTRVVPTGLSLVVVGLLAVSTLDSSSPLWRIYLAWIPMIGMATTMSPLTSLIMSSVPLGRAGVGSAMNDTTRELGGALGVAVLGSVVTSIFASSLDGDLGGLSPRPGTRRTRVWPEHSTSPVDWATPDRHSPAGGALSAFVDGLTTAAVIAAVVVAVTAVIARRLLPRDENESPLPGRLATQQSGDREAMVLEAVD